MSATKEEIDAARKVLLEKLQAFQTSADEVLEAFGQCELNGDEESRNVFADCYPFEVSFDDMAEWIQGWVWKVEERFTGNSIGAL